MVPALVTVPTWAMHLLRCPHRIDPAEYGEQATALVRRLQSAPNRAMPLLYRVARRAPSWRPMVARWLGRALARGGVDQRDREAVERAIRGS